MKNKPFVPSRIKNVIGKCLVPLLFFILLSTILPGCFSKKDAVLFPVRIIVFFIQLLGIPFIVYLVMRIVMVRLSRRFMRTKSHHAGIENENEKKETVSPPAEIGFKEFSETDDISLSKDQGKFLELAINTGMLTWNIFKKSVGFVLLGTVIIFFASKLLVGEFKVASPVWVSFTTLMMYFFVKLRYRATRRISFRICLFSYLPLLFFYNVYFVFNYAQADSGIISWLFFILITSSFFYVIYRFFKIKKRAAPVGNKQLLILRVFGSDHNTAFLFREISRTWRFLGSFITIADPSYIRYQYSLSSRENRKIFFNLFFLYFIVLGIVTLVIQDQLSLDFPSWLLLLWIKLRVLQLMFVMGVLMMLVILPLLLTSLTLLTYKRFIPSIGRLNRIIEKIIHNRRNVSATFKNFTLFCFDNIWKTAVKQILPVAKAVLMDLRGFNPQRRGCQYEIGLLMNNYPVNKILFLADEGPAVETIKEIVRQEWKNMSSASPNFKIHDPELKIYYVREEDKKDINRIIALLTIGFDYSEAASKAENAITKESSIKDRTKKISEYYAAGITPVDDGLVIKKEKYRVKTRNTIGFFEKWDLRLAKPSASRIFIPTLFLLLLGGLIYQAIPFISSFSLYKDPVRIIAMPGKTDSSDQTEPGEPFINMKITGTTNENGHYGNVSYTSALFWQLRISGGKPGAAYKYSNAKISVTTTDNKELTTLDAREHNSEFLNPSFELNTGIILPDTIGTIRIENKTLLPSKAGKISRYGATMDLNFIRPDQVYTVTRPDILLAANDIVEIVMQGVKPSPKIWLERNGANKENVDLILPEYMEDYELHIFNDSTEVNYQYTQNGKIWIIKYSDLINTRIKIIQKDLFRKVPWSFEKNYSERE